MNAYRTEPVFAAPSHMRGNSADSARPEPRQEFTYAAAAATQSTQAERSVMHPEWQDPEWRYYHGAWGG
jgi:hypothetical protein